MLSPFSSLSLLSVSPLPAGAPRFALPPVFFRSPLPAFCAPCSVLFVSPLPAGVPRFALSPVFFRSPLSAFCALLFVRSSACWHTPICLSFRLPPPSSACRRSFLLIIHSLRPHSRPHPVLSPLSSAPPPPAADLLSLVPTPIAPTPRRDDFFMPSDRRKRAFNGAHSEKYARPPCDFVGENCSDRK